jgi:hypothetical protein
MFVYRLSRIDPWLPRAGHTFASFSGDSRLPPVSEFCRGALCS